MGWSLLPKALRPFKIYCASPSITVQLILFLTIDIIKSIKISKLRWTGYIMRTPEENPVKKLTLLRPEGSRRADRPKLRCLDRVEEDLRTLGIRGWRRRALERDRWKKTQ